MRTDLFDYVLPPERIAQTPNARGQSRLLILERATGGIAHRQFSDLPAYLQPGDTLVVNDTRVTARRLQAIRESGLAAEVFLLRPVGDTQWEALVRPGRPLRVGRSLQIFGPDGAQVAARIVGETPEGGRLLDVDDGDLRDRLALWGETPLPPYIHEALPPDQESRYQTVYAQVGGSAAAPTAGLHFTPELLAQLRAQGVALASATLHVGVGTFRPVRVDDIAAHEMHAETARLSPEAADTINATPGRIIAVGTTSVRVLETAAARLGSQPEAPATEMSGRQPRVAPFAGDTNLFITPGYDFRAVDVLITNFHLPRSTLLMLISAFAGRENVLRAYQAAIDAGYYFFSFGDAMLII